MYGTIKSEVWATMPGVSEDYFRYEIITRWKPVNPKDDKSAMVTWSTFIIYINRDGESERVEVNPSSWFENWINWLKLNHVSSAENGYEARAKMREEHDYAIRLCIG
jgi:hypothetical protein